jgi:hypothetical protein
MSSDTVSFWDIFCIVILSCIIDNFQNNGGKPSLFGGLPP